MNTKLCRECWAEKMPSDFYLRKHNIDGLSSYCKRCTKEKVFDWREKHPAERKAKLYIDSALRKGLVIKPDTCQICSFITPVKPHFKDLRNHTKFSWVCASCYLKLERRKI